MSMCKYSVRIFVHVYEAYLNFFIFLPSFVWSWKKGKKATGKQILYAQLMKQVSREIRKESARQILSEFATHRDIGENKQWLKTIKSWGHLLHNDRQWNTNSSLYT